MSLHDSETPFSKRYWIQRYAAGNTSGPGSHGRLASYKADYVNNFIHNNRISSVAEFGVGDGNQLSRMNYPIKFKGYDISEDLLCRLRVRFPQHQFELAWNKVDRFDLGVSMDVIYHLIEDDIYSDYMHNLFEASLHYVIIYSSNCQILETAACHVRHRIFTEFVMRKFPKWRLVKHSRNPFAYSPGKDMKSFSHSDFYTYMKCQTKPS